MIAVGLVILLVGLFILDRLAAKRARDDREHQSFCAALHGAVSVRAVLDHVGAEVNALVFPDRRRA